jgi:protein-S-isoprenylcysteine O-methyltransferase Ste14
MRATTRSLWMALRHVAAVLMLPAVMTIVVPRWLLAAYRASDTRWGHGALAWAGRSLGALLLLAGLALFAWCLSLFVRVGRGTLAPWDPTTRLVAVGPYRRVRNPMITGVVTVLAGEALLVGSRVLGVWALTFLAFNHAHFLLVEEPGLERRFGESYLEYKRAVPRWIPRFRAIRSGEF